MKIAVVQLAAWGDVVISTVIPHAIKRQRPGWHVTYITTSACRGAIDNNPDIDNPIIHEGSKNDGWGMQDTVIADARRSYDLVIAPWPGFRQRHDWRRHNKNHLNFMYSYIAAAQDLGLEVPDPATIYLYPTAHEEAKAAHFLAGQGLHRPSVLMEINGESGQTHWDDGCTDLVIRSLMKKFGGEINVWVSGKSPDPDIITALKSIYSGRISYLCDYSLREVSVIARKANFFIGCSSGTSNACQTHLSARGLLWFENVNDGVWSSIPIGTENKYTYVGSSSHDFVNMVMSELNARF